VLCATCRRQVAPATVCGACGAPAPGASAPLELVLADGTRVPILGAMTIGRSSASTLCLDDPSVSRNHARIHADGDGLQPLLEDTGSSYGTFVDDARLAKPVFLHSGMRIGVGNQQLEVQAQRAEHEAGRTIVVPVGASLQVSTTGMASLQQGATAHGQRPRLRSGYALKRLDASEGDRRWVVHDLNSETFLRLSDRDAQLLQLLDGTRSLADLVGEAEQAFGAAGVPALARLLAELGERGMLASVEGAADTEDAVPQSGWRRLLRTRERSFHGVGPIFGRIYRSGGWLLFTRPALAAILALAIGGFGVFVALVVGRYGTPFVVAHRLVLGGLVFLAGRALLVVLHELAHALAMEFVGRRVRRAGLKVVVVFPYAFVDTSDVWFEPRRRRAFVTVAGPLSDLALAGAFAILCLALAPGTIRDVAFQVAFAGYVAAFFNLNPFLERDGYQILADRLGVPGLRARARAQQRRRLAGTATGDADPALNRYAIAGLGWSLAAVALAIVFSLRYQPIMIRYASSTVVWIVFGTLWAVLFVPVGIILAPPLAARLRGRWTPREAAPS
jgi:putative peptide zinc metalloprotease protein